MKAKVNEQAQKQVMLAQVLCHIRERLESDLEVTRMLLCAWVLLMVFALFKFISCMRSELDSKA